MSGKRALHTCLCLAVLEAASGTIGASGFQEVRTPLGVVRGKNYGQFLAFKGIPYAEKPLRFASPAPKLPWNGTFDGTHFGDACVSSGSHQDKDPLESYRESEDCLVANIWVPKGALNHSLPVVVWIHGGGFMMRTANYAGYWGDGFASNPGPSAILVTFNYRLGIFGFYSSEDTGANAGFQDQQMLLRWVQENIKSLGGDPRRVTLSGQSAGAMSVVCHLAAPGSQGLFHRAIANSPVGLYYRSPAENAPFVLTVAKVVGCSHATDLTECMRSRSWELLKLADIAPEYLFNLQNSCPECDNWLPWMPVVDGKTLPMSPVDAIRRGVHNKVPTIVSTTRNETLAFVPTALMKIADNPVAYEEAMSILFKDRAAQIKSHYRASPDTARMRRGADLVGVITTDAMMTCYSRYMVRLLSQHARAYLSTFMIAPHSSEMHLNNVCVRGPPDGATCHASDVAYMLPSSARMAERTKITYASQAEERLAQEYTAALIGFASGQDGPFEAYSSATDMSTSWHVAGPNMTAGYHQSHCDFLESLGFKENPWGSEIGANTGIPMLV